MGNDDRKDEVSATGKRDPVNGRNKARSARDATESRRKSEWIGQQLREIYNETVTEPVPDRFIELLRQLDEKAKKSK